MLVQELQSLQVTGRERRSCVPYGFIQKTRLGKGAGKRLSSSDIFR